MEGQNNQEEEIMPKILVAKEVYALTKRFNNFILLSMILLVVLVIAGKILQPTFCKALWQKMAADKLIPFSAKFGYNFTTIAVALICSVFAFLYYKNYQHLQYLENQYKIKK